MLADLAAEREQVFRRLVLVSAAVHLVAAAVFLISPRPHRSSVLPAVVRVDLVAGAPARVAPKPAAPRAKPAPRPKPKPVPPVPEKKVLPAEPVAKPVPKPKPKPEPATVVEPKPAEPEPSELAYDDLLDQLRKEAGETAPLPTASAAVPDAGPGGGGRGVVVSPEVMAWMRRAKVHVTRAWVLAPGFRSQALETEVRVRLDARGQVIDTHIARRSGNPWYDESVERAVRKASPLPAPPEADEWSFVFRPRDLL